MVREGERDRNKDVERNEGESKRDGERG